MPFLSVVFINMMKWLSKIIIAIVITSVIAAGIVLAILNPQMLTINLWGWITIEYTIATWSLIILAVGIVVGVSLASVLIIKLQSQLYACQRKLLHWQGGVGGKENQK